MVLTVDEDVEIKSNAGKLFTLISNQHHTVPKAASDRVHDVEIHEGDWETSGSVKQWKYTLDGNVETFKEKVEIDEANKVVSLTALEGSHVLDVYKSYKVIFKVTPKGDGEGGVVKVNLEYQKHNETDPPPEKYLSFLVNCIKDIDAHLLKE